MSEAHNEHESLIKTPKQLITVVVLAFIVPITIIALLVSYVGNAPKVGAGSSGDAAEAAGQRIRPVAQLELKDPNGPRVYQTGEQLYKAVCSACHGSGLPGAPQFGDAAAWAPRLAQGLDGLVHSLINGKGAMAARAGTSADDYSDYELARAVVYLANSGGGTFVEPAAPTAAAPAAASETAASTAETAK